ncbi:MAG TPA: phytoene desaturase family protein [Thermoanaerobaculia bacterium]|nr:phytoene desaturase family protein [Thermoanaerobaculia bacterium]
MTRRAVVVGAGPGGLASALLLAGAGMDVTLLERENRVGGRTSALEAEGFRFDLGPTFFLYPRVLEEIFASVGLDLHDEVEMVRLDPQYRLLFGAGGSIDATPDLAGMERQVAAIAPGDAANLGRFLDDNRVKMREFRPILESPWESWRDLLSPSLARLLPLVRPWRSLDSELGRYFSDERIRMAFSFQSKYLGMSPFRCPSLFSILSFLEYEHGVFHPLGGCAAVSEAMGRVARRLGVDVRLGEPVERLVFRGRQVVGAQTTDGFHPADAVVVNADFARAAQRMIPDELRPTWNDAKIEKSDFSCSTFMLYLGLDGAQPELPHHTIYIADDYRRNLDDIEKRHRLSDDPSFYVQNACVTDPELAPPGMSTLYVLVPVTHQHPNVDWGEQRLRYRRVALDQLAKIGLPDVERRIRFEHVVTPRDWDRRYGIHLGATFNLSHSFRQMLHLRPRNRFDDVDGLYLVGGGTHPGSGLPVIFESARISSRLLLEDMGLSMPDGRSLLPAGFGGHGEVDDLADALREAV